MLLSDLSTTFKNCLTVLSKVTLKKGVQGHNICPLTWATPMMKSGNGPRAFTRNSSPILEDTLLRCKTPWMKIVGLLRPSCPPPQKKKHPEYILGIGGVWSLGPVTFFLDNSPWLPGYRWYVTCSYHYPYLFIPWCPVCTCRCLQISQGLWTSRMYYITIIYIIYIYILYTKPMAVKKSLTRPIWLSPGIIASHGLVSALGPLTMS